MSNDTTDHETDDAVGSVYISDLSEPDTTPPLPVLAPRAACEGAITFHLETLIMFWDPVLRPQLFSTIHTAIMQEVDRYVERHRHEAD